ncbi:uncharacterized protein LOC128803191 isoform X2 [Vidua macroura]|uniref:uncharacterized protein LOC128803191 isoform X2 n=1 Tax=Vidua macroura TaxID=187451 RepID=UPI0023A901AA|nr:uncharacterized protein LOC128803191 isoform X2 [Vidua macroura]
MNDSQEVSQGQECPKQEPSQEELSDWEERIEEDPSQGEVTSYHERCDWEEYFPEQELSLTEVSSSQDLSDWEEYTEQGLLGGDAISCAEHSNGEEYIGQDLSQREACTGQDMARGNGSRPSGQSSSEDDSYKELVQENCEDKSSHGIWTKPLAPEEEEWDEHQMCAPHSPPSLSSAQLGAQTLHRQPAAPRKCPSCFRQALRALQGLFQPR